MPWPVKVSALQQSGHTEENISKRIKENRTPKRKWVRVACQRVNEREQYMKKWERGNSIYEREKKRWRKIMLSRKRGKRQFLKGLFCSSIDLYGSDVSLISGRIKRILCVCMLSGYKVFLSVNVSFWNPPFSFRSSPTAECEGTNNELHNWYGMYW